MTEEIVRRVGTRAVAIAEDVGLVLVLMATLVAAGVEVSEMVARGEVKVADLLLLFIYLEVMAMVAAYWKAGHMPVRMPLYIAMVALARHLILDITHLEVEKILATGATIMMIGVAVLVVRYGHVRFPYDSSSQK